MSDPGLRFSESSSLVSHAVSLIEEKPRHTSKIAGRVFGLSNGPPGLAARLVFELLPSRLPSWMWRRPAFRSHEAAES
ncbi:MAG: hypothetical protein P8Y07_05750 [Gemmatimonadales bacterium]